MFADVSSGQLAIPAVILGTAALVSPALALARWLQEKTFKYRYRVEMVHSKELSEFIKLCPELTETAGTARSELAALARSELTKSLANIEILLNRKNAKEAAPVEMSWPRRWFLLYSPRTKWATVFHTLFQLTLVFVISFVLLLSFDEDQGKFAFNDFHHPLFWVVVAVWALRLGMIWYIASAKDHWDGALPATEPQSSRLFLRHQAGSAPEVVARLFLLWSAWDIVFPLFFRNPVTRDWNAMITTSPELQRILNALPSATRWEQVFSWILSLFCIALAYLWAKAEYMGKGRDLWLPFPRKLRFLYPASGFAERFSRLGLVLLSASTLLTVYLGRQAIATIWPLVPEDARDSFVVGAISGSIENVLSSFVAFYGCYRLALIEYHSKDKNQPPPRAFATTTSK